jgi:hypothetical protein
VCTRTPGGVKSLAAEASRYIREKKLDDTFLLIDLGNVTRLFKVLPLEYLV